MSTIVESKHIRTKVCMVGESGTGKTDLIRRFMQCFFDDRYIQTLGTMVSKRELISTSPDGIHELKIDMVIWDILGEQRFRVLLKEEYFRGARGILAVCDVARKKTLDDLDSWIGGVQSVTGKIPIVLAINSRDRSAPEEVNESDAKRFSTTYGAPYFYTSSETGENVDAVFNALGTRVVENRFDKTRGLPP